jgi:hypothetical protein
MGRLIDAMLEGGFRPPSENIQLFAEDGFRIAIGKSILHSPTKYCHLKLFIKILFKKYQLVVLCLIYHRNFDSVVAIYDSN